MNCVNTNLCQSEIEQKERNKEIRHPKSTVENYVNQRVAGKLNKKYNFPTAKATKLKRIPQKSTRHNRKSQN